MTIPAEYKLVIEEEIRFRDTDAMGHVNNAVYLSYLELARMRYWFKVLGVKDYSEVQFILARVEIDYKSPVKLGEKIIVGLRVTDIRGASFDFDCGVWAKPWDEGGDANARLVAKAKSVQVCYDYQKAKPMRMPDDYRAKIEAFEGQKLSSS